MNIINKLKWIFYNSNLFITKFIINILLLCNKGPQFPTHCRNKAKLSQTALVCNDDPIFFSQKVQQET